MNKQKKTHATHENPSANSKKTPTSLLSKNCQKSQKTKTLQADIQKKIPPKTTQFTHKKKAWTKQGETQK